MSFKKTFTKVTTTLAIAGATAAACLGCPPTNSPVTPQPPVVTDQVQCAAACANLQRLGCDEGNPIDMHTKCDARITCPTGQACSALGTCMVTCTQFCIDTENAGVWLDPVCVSKITACNQIDQCPVAKPKGIVNSCAEGNCPIAN